MFSSGRDGTPTNRLNQTNFSAADSSSPHLRRKRCHARNAASTWIHGVCALCPSAVCSRSRSRLCRPLVSALSTGQARANANVAYSLLTKRNINLVLPTKSWSLNLVRTRNTPPTPPYQSPPHRCSNHRDRHHHRRPVPVAVLRCAACTHVR